VPVQNVLVVDDLDADDIRRLLGRFGLTARNVSRDEAIPGSYWGEPEAGIIGTDIYMRADTPVHSMLHESCHIICMDAGRRKVLDRDAGGDDLEEAAVCYLQIVLADELPGAGRHRLMRDMDAWGYSFRLGSTARWFAEDAADAANWLLEHGLLSRSLAPTFRIRS
jgi:hypothetical protein